jgi:hypothetical protein
LASSGGNNDGDHVVEYTPASSLPWLLLCGVAVAVSIAALADTGIPSETLCLATATCVVLLAMFGWKNRTASFNQKVPRCQRHIRARPRSNKGLPGSALESVDLSGKHAPFVPSIFSSQFVRRSRELEPHCAETADRPLRRHSKALCTAELEN